MQPKILEEVQRIGNLSDSKTQSRTVYDADGVSPTLCSGMDHGNTMPHILNQTIVAMRGRNPDNPSDRTVGSPTEQRLEPNSQGICNTLTSVQKDNLVMEKAERFFKQALQTLENGDCEVGDTVDAFNGKVNKSGVSPTITTRPEGFKTAILPVVQEKAGMTQSGCVDCDNCRYRSEDCLCDVSENEEECPLSFSKIYRIRKLTPKECWRLMDFTDEDFEKAAKVNSNTQLYKQAGNSIVKNVLVAILGQMIPGKENVYKEVNKC